MTRARTVPEQSGFEYPASVIVTPVTSPLFVNSTLTGSTLLMRKGRLQE